MAIKLALATRNALVNALAARVDAGAGPGQVRIYSGAQPATGDDAATGTLLATVNLADPSFAAAANGTINATDPVAVTGAANGDAGWFRVVDSAGNAVYDGSVSLSGGGGDMIVNTLTVSTGVQFDITAISVTMPAS